MDGSKNSASNIFTFEGKTKIEFPKNGVPGPIIISLKNQPTKILPKPNITKGMDILRGDSPPFLDRGSTATE